MRSGNRLLRVSAVGALVLAAGWTTGAVGQPTIPDPAQSGPQAPELGQLDRIGVSPCNHAVSPAFRYRYVFILRDSVNEPVANFPASQAQLDFGACTRPSTRPADRMPADGPSDALGRIEWSTNLGFGGADPCAVEVWILGVLFHAIPAADPGGVRSPDIDGDGLISLSDTVHFQVGFASGGPPWIGDLALPFDDLIGLDDLVWAQQHFVGC
jgi:hypothetical protein